MLRRLLISAVIAGALAAAAMTVLQNFLLMPLILRAEAIEGAHAAASAAAGAHDAHGATSGLSRFLLTVLSNLLAGVGFALLLSAAYALRGAVDARRGLLWGLGGFAAFALAPALGLPPELPGSMAADLGARQAWWLMAASGTAAGLALAVLMPGHLWKMVGAGLMALPHVVGAPQPDGHGSVPGEMAAAFVSASLIANLLFWVVLGIVSGAMHARLAPPEAAV